MSVRSGELLRDSFVNMGRRKLRTGLSVLAVFIGAFTLALTSGVGTGINQYIDAQLSALGAEDTLFVSSGVDQPAPGDLAEYSSGEEPGASVVTADDLDRVTGLQGVSEGSLVPAVQTEYIARDGGDRYQFTLGDSVPGMRFDAVAGGQLDYGSARSEIVLPVSYLDDLGYGAAEDAVGTEVAIGVRDFANETREVRATVAGVINRTILEDSPRGNQALMDTLHEQQMAGAPTEEQGRFPGLVVQASDVVTARESIEGAGYRVSSLDDQLGEFQSVVDAIILVLNVFAVLALVTAAFGIVNTLLMSVQDRTREIGILRAMGIGRRQVFAMFALEAAWMALLGAVLAILAAVAVGSSISGPLAEALDVDLVGLTLVAFTPEAIVAEIVLIVAIALVAAVMPALRASKLDPIEAIRHE
ncbi:ABC transporter permease YtrF precursor [Clavibacter michiganensis]|nr:ABC transporter permease YtrF precursor [Clavibacter michiganensis]